MLFYMTIRGNAASYTSEVIPTKGVEAEFTESDWQSMTESDKRQILTDWVMSNVEVGFQYAEELS